MLLFRVFGNGAMGRLRSNVCLRVTGRLLLNMRSGPRLLLFGLTAVPLLVRLSNRLIFCKFPLIWLKMTGNRRVRFRRKLLLNRLSVFLMILLIKLRCRTCYGFRVNNRRRYRPVNRNSVGKVSLVCRRNGRLPICGRGVSLVCGPTIITVSHVVFCRRRLITLIRCRNCTRGRLCGRLVVLTVWRKRLIGCRWLVNRCRWLNIRKFVVRRRT